MKERERRREGGEKKGRKEERKIIFTLSQMKRKKGLILPCQGLKVKKSRLMSHQHKF